MASTSCTSHWVTALQLEPDLLTSPLLPLPLASGLEKSLENSVLSPAGKWRLCGSVQELQQRRRTASPWPSAAPQSSLQGAGASGSVPQARAHQHCDHTVRPASAGSSRASARPAHTRTDSSEETEAHREAKLCPWSCHQRRRASSAILRRARWASVSARARVHGRVANGTGGGHLPACPLHVPPGGLSAPWARVVSWLQLGTSIFHD